MDIASAGKTEKAEQVKTNYCMKVKIYVSDQCPACQNAIEFFRQRGLKYEVINITFNQERFDEMTRLGGIATPFIVIGERMFHSFERRQIELYLEEKHE